MSMYEMSHSPEKTARKEWFKNIQVFEYGGNEEQVILQ